MSGPIGRIHLPGEATATLTAAGDWECDDEDVLARLQSSHDPRRATGVAAVMPFGVQAVLEGAADIGGEPELLVKIRPLEEGEVS